MHRTVEITVPPASTSWLLEELGKLDHVVGLSVHRGASVKPPGDVVVVHALNRGMDDVLRCADVARGRGAISIVTAEVASIIDPQHQDAVDDDVDEAIWEEAATGLRHQGRVTPNFLALMAAGGAVAAAGLVSEPGHQAVLLVASSVIAPGFEPLAKIPLGLALRNWPVVRRGLVSAGIGYAVLVAAAALMLLLLRAADATTAGELVGNPEVHRIERPTLKEFLVSACAAVAGLVMVLAYRRSVIAGPLIALTLIPAAALIGAGLAAGEPALAYQGLERLLVDAALIVVLGVVVVVVKQATVHRRPPMA